MRASSLMAFTAALTLVLADASLADGPKYIPPPPSPKAPFVAPAPAPSPTTTPPATAPASPAATAAAAAPAPAPAKVGRTRLLVMDLKGNDVDPATTKTVQGVVTTELSYYQELDVVSGDDVKNLVQLQAEKSSMGCDEAGCLAEIADALGAKLVVFGTLGKLGDAMVLNLNLFDAEKATGLGRVVVQTDSVKLLTKKLRPKLHDLLGRFYQEHGLTLPPLAVDKEELVAAAPPPEPSSTPWIVAGVGGAVFVVGGALAVFGALPLLQYNDAKARVQAAEKAFAKDVTQVNVAKSAQKDLVSARSAWNSTGYLSVDAGSALAGVGLVAGIAGLVWGLSEPEPPVAPAPAGGTP